jgi:hypothetical protein
MLLALIAAGCGGSVEAAPNTVVRTADQVQVVSPAEAEQLLADGQARVGDAVRTDRSGRSGPDGENTDGQADGTGGDLAVTEANRSFQVRLGTALTVFNTCLGEVGYSFVGLPGQTDDPVAAEPGYIGALISCNNESGIGAILAEQNARQQDLTADQKVAINESGRTVFECLIDRGWDLGELQPNENGILTVSRFPDVPPSRQTEFQRDLDECGWNDLDLG